MPSPNIFYAYTESYPPSMHPSQLWKYNNCNSFPKVGTSVYTSAKNRKTSCLPARFPLQLVAALFDNIGQPYDIVGFSGTGLIALGPTYPPTGSLTPSSAYGTRILGIYTHDLPMGPSTGMPQQIHIAMSGAIPTSFTFTGGDLTKSYTLKTADAYYAPSANPAIWYWLNQGFYFRPGVVYNVFINE